MLKALSLYQAGDIAAVGFQTKLKLSLGLQRERKRKVLPHATC